MVAKTILFLFAVQCSLNVLAQEIEQTYKWETSISFAYEQHDKRLFENYPTIFLDADENERWGTYWYGVSVERVLLQNDLYQFKMGIGYASEIRTLERPFIPQWLLKDFTFNYIGPPTNRYKVKHIQIPFVYSIPLGSFISLNVGVIPDFSFFKRAAFLSKIGNYYEGISKFSIDFYSISLHPGLQCVFDKVFLALDYRLFQLKKIDKVIPPDPFNTQETFETYNPTNIRLTVGYAFGEKKLDTGNGNQ